MAFEIIRTMTWNVLIFDDEVSVHHQIRQLLSEHQDLRVVAETADGGSALAKFLEGTVHLMFLDIQSYRTSRCNFLHQVTSAQMPPIIFLTGSRGQAIDALELLSLEYLIKPIIPSRMVDAISRARTRLVNRPSSSQLNGKLAKLLVRKGAREVLISVNSINWIEADGNDATIHCDNDRHFVRCSIGELEQRIEKRLFLRVNRSALINVDRVAELRHAGKTVQVVLSTGESLQATLGLRELRDRLQFR